MEYVRRVVDDELDELMAGLAAMVLEGPKAVGKTATASRRARTIVGLDDPGQLAVVAADPSLALRGEPPVLIDEWQRVPETWDVVRREVDADRTPGHFLLTGSATPVPGPAHSGAGRIVTVRMRPMTLPERGIETPSVSMRSLMSGTALPVVGDTKVDLTGYVAEILASGFPGIRPLGGRSRRAALDGYIDRIVERDFELLGRPVRNPAVLRRWMAAYAAATATTATFETIRDAATGGAGEKPARTTVVPYHDVLSRLWVVEPVPAWWPSVSRLKRLVGQPKHHLADPALAARLLNLGEGALLQGRGPRPATARGGPLLAALFESLACLSVRVFAQAAEARVFHFRTKAGEREIDLIVEGDDGRVLAIEVKLARTITDEHVRHLTWLRDQLGSDLLDAVVISTGPAAYRRKDGIAVVPLALLGP